MAELFDYLKALTETKEDLTADPSFKKTYNPFMINRWVSMNAATIYQSYFASTLQRVEKETHYKFLLHLLPQQKIYFKYAKKEKASKDIELLMDYYNIGYLEAKEYFKVLTTTELKSIKDILKTRR